MINPESAIFFTLGLYGGSDSRIRATFGMKLSQQMHAREAAIPLRGLTGQILIHKAQQILCPIEP